MKIMFLFLLSTLFLSALIASQRCNSDTDCQGLDRPSCCVRSTLGPYRVCKALGDLGDPCNSYSMPHMWHGQRNGHFCPCRNGLTCVGGRRGGCLMGDY